MQRRASLFPGQHFGPFAIERVLGVGGMGAVYAGRHRATGRAVAIKTMHEALARDAHLKARFVREAKAVSRVAHPNVVRVLAADMQDERPYVVMELLEGEDLRSLLDREGPMSPEAACALLAPVARGIAYAHARGVVHRDLKPDNIFLARQPDGTIEPKILDFGVSKMSGESSMTADATLLGTPHYMSPEHVEGAGSVGAFSDQFSLGVILYEAITGELPFQGRSLYPLLSAISLCEPKAPSHHCAHLSARLEATILRAMSREPTERFADMAEFAQRLRAESGVGRSQVRLRRVARLPEGEGADTMLDPKRETPVVPWHETAMGDAS